MPDDDALRFAERLLALLDATRHSATYKLATLLAIVDVTAERTGRDGSAPAVISGKEVARRVIELYWPQTVPTVLLPPAANPGSCRKQPRTTSQPSLLPGEPSGALTPAPASMTPAPRILTGGLRLKRTGSRS